MSTAGRTRVVVVDDHAVFRSGVRAELAGYVDVVAEAEDVPSAVSAIIERQPDVVLLDVHLPGGGGVEVLREVLPRVPSTRVLALSVSDAADDVVGIIRAGARGYVTKTVTGPELVEAITRVAAGDAVFSPRLAGFVLDAFAAEPAAMVTSGDPDLDRLSPREREVLRLIARGYTYREAARELVLSVRTIETHVSNVLHKLQLSNRNELARWAAARRLV